MMTAFRSSVVLSSRISMAYDRKIQIRKQISLRRKAFLYVLFFKFIESNFTRKADAHHSSRQTPCLNAQFRGAALDGVGPFVVHPAFIRAVSDEWPTHSI